MIESQREINELIRKERDALVRAGKKPRIVVAGFSQGEQPGEVPCSFKNLHIAFQAPS